MDNDSKNKSGRRDNFWDDFWRSKKQHAFSEILMYGIMIISILLGILILG